MPLCKAVESRSLYIHGFMFRALHNRQLSTIDGHNALPGVP